MGVPFLALSVAQSAALMPQAHRILLALRSCLLVGFAGSVVSTIDYLNAGDPAFCGVGSGCFAVRVSPFSHLFGVPMPHVGLLAFTLLFIASIVARTEEHCRRIAVAAGVAGAVGVALLCLQAFVIHAWCPWCVAVDASAIATALFGGLLARSARNTSDAAIIPSLFDRATWLGAFGLTIATPIFWSTFPVTPPLPAELAKLQELEKITVIEFTDFECPFCRRLHPELLKLAEAHPGKLRILRKMVPLPMHAGARPAAAAYLCTPSGQHEIAANLLYEMPEARLSREGVIDLADALHLERAAFERCLDDSSTQSLIEDDTALYRSVSGRGLPLTYVGPHPVLGYNPQRLEKAFASADAPPRFGLPVKGLVACLAMEIIGALALTLRHERQRRSSASVGLQ